MIQEQCAFKEKNICRALLDCNCENCSFYKTENELAYERELASQRIDTLSLRKQAHIRRKYYGIDEDKMK